MIVLFGLFEDAITVRLVVLAHVRFGAILVGSIVRFRMFVLTRFTPGSESIHLSIVRKSGQSLGLLAFGARFFGLGHARALKYVRVRIFM